MVTCANGHPNAVGWEFCGECGAPIGDAVRPSTTRTWYRTRWATVGLSGLGLLLIAGALVVARDDDPSTSSSPTSVESAAIQEWWSGAHEHFTELQNSLDDAQRAVRTADGRGFKGACQDMHDAGEVDLQAHLPTPDPDLTSELQAAIEDAHSAGHLCLSVVAGSMTNYDSEFLANVDEAMKELKAAQERINNALAGTQ